VKSEGQNCCLVGRCKLQTTDLAKNETGQQPIGSNNHSRGTKCPPSNTQLPPQQQNSLQSICEEEQLVAQRQINTEEENPSPPTFSSNGDENYEDCDDGDNDSMVSNAGSEHSLIRSSVSQKRGSS
jgi:hypothetical protein